MQQHNSGQESAGIYPQRRLKHVLLIANDNPVDPLGIMYLISNTKALFDVIFVNKNSWYGKILNCDLRKYDIVGFSTITGSHRLHGEIAAAIKKRSNIRTIMGGPHPTYFPREALRLPGIDTICMGEGISSFGSYLNDIPRKNIVENGEPIPGILDSSIPDFWTPPDRTVVYAVDGRGKNPIKNFMGSFGCAFNCSYCYNDNYNSLHTGKKVRYLKPELILKDVKDCIKNYETKILYFEDDTFTTNVQWFKDVSNGLKKTGMPYHCQLRCDTLTSDTVEQLKRTGCRSVTFAIENGNEIYRREYLNRSMSNDAIIEGAAMLRKAKIMFRIENMVGLPFNTLDDNFATLDLNRKCRPTVAWSALYQPYPNTTLGNLCVREKLWPGDLDSICDSFFDISPILISDKLIVQRLQKLFGFLCSFPFLKPLLYLFSDKWCLIIYKWYKKIKYKKLYGV